MKTLNWQRIAIIALAFAVFTSFWLFSRFSVDDAFISWRYGQNLVDWGVWNYNPSSFDETQAYTNPIFAILSIIPAFFNINFVLFFKLLSMLTVLAFGYWFLKKTNGSWLWLLLFLAIPPTLVHAFSGLETFVWAFLAAALAVALFENRFNTALVTTVLLFLTRPEAWTLVVTVPVYFWLATGQKMSFKKLNWSRAFIAFGILAGALAIYFAFHFVVFGELLPNTFYVKSGQSFSIVRFAFFGFFLLPLIAVYLSKNYKIAVALTLTFLPIVINESTSDLIVNYQSRYAFHVFAPIFIFVAYLISQGAFAKFKKLAVAMALTSITVFQLSAIPGTLDLVTSNPRLQESHVKLGLTLKALADEGKIRNFAFGDAGATALYSGLSNLDNIGLGSRLMTKNGLTDQLFADYQVDVTVLHATTNGIRTDEYNLQKVLDWSKANGLVENCNVYFRPNYLLTIYAREQFPTIHALCESSKTANAKSESQVFSETVANTPWSYWK